MLQNKKATLEFRIERLSSELGINLHHLWTALLPTVIQATTSRVVAFGMGRRLCPGEALARMQIFLVLAFLLQRYEFIANGPLIAKPSKPQMFLREPEEYTCNIKVRPAANQ